MSDTQIRRAAREAYAAALTARGPEFRNMADSIRAGFENIWIAPALDALERTARTPLDDGNDD